MLASVIFGSLAGLASVVIALTQGIDVARTLVIYLTVSAGGTLGLPLLTLLWIRFSSRP